MSRDNEEDMSSFGSRLKFLRKQVGLTQGDLAVRAQIARDTVSRYERGEVSPTVDALTKIVSALGPDIEAGWLLFGPPQNLIEPPIRIPGIGIALALRFRPRGVVDVGLNESDISSILGAISEVESAKKNPSEEILGAVKTLRESLWDEEGYGRGYSFIAEVVIAARGVKLKPIIPVIRGDSVPIDEKNPVVQQAKKDLDAIRRSKKEPDKRGKSPGASDATPNDR